MQKLLPYVDAANIDLKAFRKPLYKDGWRFFPCKSLYRRSGKNCHVELCYLLIPGLNDGLDEVEEAAEWIASRLHRARTPGKWKRHSLAYFSIFSDLQTRR